MNINGASWREDWAPESALPFRGSSFVQRQGRRQRCSPASLPRLPTVVVPSDPSAEELDATHPMQIDPGVRLECPACTMQAQMDDFNLVRVGSSDFVHCPACDANLGSLVHSFRHAA